MGAMTLIAAVTCVVTNTLPLNQVLVCFSSSIVWLIVSAFLLAKGFIKTGLGSRIAYYFLVFFGKSLLPGPDWKMGDGDEGVPQCSNPE